METNIVQDWGVCIAHCPFCQGEVQEGVLSDDSEESKNKLERFRVYHNEYHSANGRVEKSAKIMKRLSYH